MAVSSLDDYISAAPSGRREALAELRRLCLEVLVGFEEAMDYGMPGYTRVGVGEVGFANQKQYISLYILRTDVLNAHRERLGRLSVGKGCIRYRRAEQINWEVVRSMLTMTATTSGPVC